MTEPRAFTVEELAAREYTRRRHYERFCRACSHIVECWQDKTGRNAPMVRNPDEPSTLTPHYMLCREPVKFGFGKEEKPRSKKTWDD